MTTSEALDHKTEAVNRLVSDAIENARRDLDIADKSKEILMRVPDDILWCANASGGYIQFSSCTREQTKVLMNCLSAGRWEKKVCHGNEIMLDYEATINGVRVLIYCTPPPGSCRIVEETFIIPAQAVTKRKLICAPDKPVADCLALAKSVAATTNEE